MTPHYTLYYISLHRQIPQRNRFSSSRWPFFFYLYESKALRDELHTSSKLVVLGTLYSTVDHWNNLKRTTFLRFFSVSQVSTLQDAHYEDGSANFQRFYQRYMPCGYFHFRSIYKTTTNWIEWTHNTRLKKSCHFLNGDWLLSCEELLEMFPSPREV